ncbi:MAG: flagellin [bacterium]|nr:flagellin [bacterium]
MTLRINHNVAAINAHRNLVNNDAKLSKTLEHLSSGTKINRAADGPAALVISEQMRAQVAGLSQAVMNSESAVAMVQTAEANLNEVNRLLVSMRQLSIHAANEGGNDEAMLEADQAELANALDSIDRISKAAQYGKKQLLDGSHGVNGIASGPDLEFISANTKTNASPQSGYSVQISQEATQARALGSQVLTQDMINAGEKLTIQENGRTVQVITQLGETHEEIQNRLNNEFRESELNLDAYFDQGRLTLIHRDYGSEAGFTVSSSTAGVLSSRADTPMWVQNGHDVQGTIGGEIANGKGQMLSGGKGTNVEGLEVRFTGVADPLKPEVGRVSVESNAFTFQVGGNRNQIVKIQIPNMKAAQMAKNVSNESGYQSLRDLDLRTVQGSQDALLLIDEAIDQVSSTRANLGAVQKNTLESNLTSLSVARENLINAESVIRDTDMASEMSDFTKYQIMSQSATAMLAQANQTPNNVLSLLK